MRKLFLFLMLASTIYGCTNADASSAKPVKQKVPVTTYSIFFSGKQYNDIKNVVIDSTTHSVSFHIPAIEGGCGCGDEPAKDITISGEYTLEKVTK